MAQHSNRRSEQSSGSNGKHSVDFLTMGRPSGDDMILSHNDAVLRRSDLDILGGPHFLNDRTIEFYFSYLSSNNPSDDIFLVPPSIAFWLQNCSDAETLKVFIEPLNLPARKLVIFPVNNNDDVEVPDAGSHWSLLAFHRTANVFVHHDSCGGANSTKSMRLYTAVVKFMGSDLDIQYVEYKASPQQQNGYDCGLFVTAIARVICSWYTKGDSVKKYTKGGSLKSEDLWFSAVKEQVTPSTVSLMRSEILDLIKGLMTVK